MQITERVISSPSLQLHSEETIRIRLNPVTRKELLATAVELLNVEFEGPLVATAKKTSPMAWETLYQFNQTYYVGKVNPGLGLLPDPRSDLNLAVVREKIGYDLYRELGKGIFDIPSTYLSSQILLDEYHQDDPFMRALQASGINNCWRILSPYPANEGNLRLGQTKTLSASDEPISFCEYIRRYRRIPNTLIHPDGLSVPLVGLVELLAVMRVVGDTNGFGAHAEHVGIVWTKNAQGIISSASVIKLDAGHALSFDEAEHHYPTKDIPIASNDPTLIIEWEQLPQPQKELFLSTLLNCLRYKNNQGVADLLVRRQGKFSLSEEVSNQQIHRFADWLDRQEDVYGPELTTFILQHPHLLLRIAYLDQYGEVSLVTTNETYPIRELYTHFILVEHASVNEENPSPSPNNSNDPSSLLSSTQRFQTEEEVAIDRIFTIRDETGQERVAKNVGIVGPTGMGKSLLCQQIAHQMASHQLWPQYKYVYWLPLRLCNTVESLKQEKDPLRWLATAITTLVLQQPPQWLTKEFQPEQLINSFHAKLSAHLSESLVLFDGNDEALPHISGMIQSFLSLPQLKVLVTSRPEALHFSLDRLLESKGFSQVHIGHYARRFFARHELTPIHAEEQTNAFLKALSQFPICLKMAQNPLLLQLLCKTWEEHRLQGLPPTATTLYESMMGGFLKDSPPNTLEALATLAQASTQSALLMMPVDFIETQLALFSPLSLQDLIHTDVIRANVGDTYSFLHLSFQQYLVAWHISQKPKQEIHDFIVTHRHYPNMRQTLVFLAGILSQKNDSLQSAKSFFTTLHQRPGNDLTGAYTFSLLLSCLKECDDSSPLFDWINQTYLVQQTLLFMQRREVQGVEYAPSPYEKGLTPFKTIIPEIPSSWLLPLAYDLGGILTCSKASSRTQAIMYLAEIIRVAPINQILDLLALPKLGENEGHLYPLLISAVINRVEQLPDELMNPLAEFSRNVFLQSKSSLSKFSGAMLLGILSQATNNLQLEPEANLVKKSLQDGLANHYESEKLPEIIAKMVPKTTAPQTLQLFQALIAYNSASKPAAEALKVLILHARPECISQILECCKQYSQMNPDERSEIILASLKHLAEVITVVHIPDLLKIVDICLCQEKAHVHALEVIQRLSVRFPNYNDTSPAFEGMRGFLDNLASPQLELRRQGFSSWKAFLSCLPPFSDEENIMYYNGIIHAMDIPVVEVDQWSQEENSIFIGENLDVLLALLQRLSPTQIAKLPNIHVFLMTGCYIALGQRAQKGKTNLIPYLEIWSELVNSSPTERNRATSLLYNQATENPNLGPCVSIIYGAFFCGVKRNFKSIDQYLAHPTFACIPIEKWKTFIFPVITKDDVTLENAMMKLREVANQIQTKCNEMQEGNFTKEQFDFYLNQFAPILGMMTVICLNCISRGKYFFVKEQIPFLLNMPKNWALEKSENNMANAMMLLLPSSQLIAEAITVCVKPTIELAPDSYLFEIINQLINNLKDSECMDFDFMDMIADNLNRLNNTEINDFAESLKSSISTDDDYEELRTIIKSLIKIISERDLPELSYHLKKYSPYYFEGSEYLSSLPTHVHFNSLSLAESRGIPFDAAPWITESCQARQIPCYVEKTESNWQISYIENNITRSYPLSDLQLEKLKTQGLMHSPLGLYLAAVSDDSEAPHTFFKAKSQTFASKGAHQDALYYAEKRLEQAQQLFGDGAHAEVVDAKQKLEELRKMAKKSPYKEARDGCLLL